MIDRTEENVMARWQSGATPMVSICCLAYNHENYISQTLDGFLMQETPFPFEIIIGEDCSPDKTMDVIREYEKKFPNLIKVIESEKNVGMHENFFRTHAACDAPYIAYCEGDDYWTDPNKLAIQVDFLEKNKEYVMSGCDAIIVDGDNNFMHESKFSCNFGKDISKYPEIKDNWTLTMSLLHRNVISEWPPEMKKVINMDLFLQALLLRHGKRKFHDDIKKCVYRVHRGGVWSLLSEKEKDDSSINTHRWLYKYYVRTENKKKQWEEVRVLCFLFLKHWLRKIPVLFFVGKFLKKLRFNR